MMFLLLTACSVKTEVHKPIDITSYKSCTLKIAIDYADLQENIANRIENLGIDVIDLKSTRDPDIVVNVRYQPVCDQVLALVQCRLTFFDIFFNDAKTGEVMISSRYQDMGNLNTTLTDSNHVDYVLDLVFDGIKKKMQVQ